MHGRTGSTGPGASRGAIGGPPQARKASSWRRARARPSGGREPPTLPGLVPDSGWGRAWASRPEGKVNSTLLPSSRAGRRPSPCSVWHIGEAGLKNFSLNIFFLSFEKGTYSYCIYSGYPLAPPPLRELG